MNDGTIMAAPAAIHRTPSTGYFGLIDTRDDSVGFRTSTGAGVPGPIFTVDGLTARAISSDYLSSLDIARTLSRTTYTGSSGSSRLSRGAPATIGNKAIFSPATQAFPSDIVDVQTETITQHDWDVDITAGGWGDAILHPNGMIYCVPRTADDVLILNPQGM